LETQLAAATAAVQEQTEAIAAVEQQLTAAQQRKAQVDQQRTVAEQEVVRRKAISDALGVAVAQATSASGQLPQDLVLAEAVRTLQAKAQESTAKVTEMADPIAKALAAAQEATAALAAVEQSRNVMLAEQTKRTAAMSH